MTDNLDIIVSLLAPFLALLILRINATIVFMSVCLGYVLVELVARGANSFVNFLAPDADSISKATWQLILFFTPVVLTCVMLLFSVKGRLKQLLNILPAAATSLLLLLLSVPLLTPGVRESIQSEPLWQWLDQTKSAAVALGAFVSLALLWTQRQAFHKDKHKKHAS